MLALAANLANAQSVSHEVNGALPAWLRFGGEYRARMESQDGIGFRDAQDTHSLNRVRLNLTVKPSAWLQFVFQGQDVRIFWNSRVASAPPFRNPMDLRMGYMQLGDPDAGPFSVRAGRQELNFGDQRLVGSTNWSNVARTFDAVRATVNYRGYRLDMFAATVVNPVADGFDRPTAGNNLHGLYMSTAALVPQATVEGYVFWRVAPGLDFKTIGTRWVGNLPARFDYDLEMAAQTTGGRGGHWQLGYRLPGPEAVKPRLIAEYNYAEPDFYTLYPTPHDKYGLTDQVGWRNAHHMRYGIEMKPNARWTLVANYRNWWRATSSGGLYSASGTLAVAAGTSSARHIGSELAFVANCVISKQMQAGAGLGHLFPGEFLRQASPGRPYTYPYLMLSYLF